MHSLAKLQRPWVALLIAYSLVTGCVSSGEGPTDADSSGTGTGGSHGTGTGGSKGGNAADGTKAGAGGSNAAQGGATLDGGTAGTGVAPRIELGSAEDFVILAKSGISTVPTSAVTGNIGVSPAAASYVTGFSLTADSTNEYSTSPQVSGKVYAADYASPTPADMTRAVGDMELAFEEAAGLAADVTELGAGDIGGMTLTPGVYQWGTGLLIPTDVTLDGDATGIWVFQVAGGLTISSATSIVLGGGALAGNVFWQISGQVELGSTAHLEGVVLTRTAVSLGTGASINGRLLAQTAVTLDGNTVVEPAP